MMGGMREEEYIRTQEITAMMEMVDPIISLA
jgi:hypothetical protein